MKDNELNGAGESKFSENDANVTNDSGEITGAAIAEEVESDKKSGPARKGFKKLEKGTTAYEIFDWLRTICIGVLAGIFIVVFLVQRDDVYGTSMNPTLTQGDILFTQKISTYFNTFKRGDIVVLDGSGMEGYTKKEYLIKRIVALPGETIRIADGAVYIKPADSSEFYLLQENYLPAGTRTIVMDDGMRKGYNEITLGENEYYCMGDNRPVSNDSRNLGPFDEKRIIAVAVIRVYPLNEIKVF